MGLISNLIERRSSFAVSDSLPDDHWFFRWLGKPSSSGVLVDEATALNTLMFVNCVSILADTFATVPVGVYRRLEPRGRETATGHSLYHVLHHEPNPHMNSFDYRHQVMVHLATWGNHFSEIQRVRGHVVALWPHHPNNVRLESRNGGRSVAYIIREGAVEREVPSRNMLHLRGLAMSGLVGLSPLAIMRQSLGIAVAAQEYGARFFANDARPSVLLKHPLTLGEEARKNLRDSWQENYGGNNRGGVGVLEEGMDVVTLSVPPEDAQFLQTRQFEAQQIAGFFRVPPHLISDVDRSTSWGTGIEQQQIGFVVHTMQPWFTRAEQEFARKLLGPEERDRYYVKFNLNALMRGDMTARKEFYATGRQWGYLSADDVRELEDMNPIENGDIYLQPLNMVEAGYVPPEQPDTQPEPTRSYRGEYRSAQEERSVTSRRRLANAHVTIYRDVIGRLIRIEKQEIRKAIRTHLRERSADSFEQWLRDYYYERFPDRAIADMRAPVSTLMTAIVAEVLDEMGADELPEGDLEAFAQGYVGTFAARHAGASRSRILKLLQDYRDEFDDETILPDLVDEELETWDERVDIEAEDEAHRSSNAASKYAYAALGVLLFRWVATGSDPCDYCSAMNGRTTSGDSAFLPAGQSLAPGGINPFVSQSSIGHPPLHKGCQCVIAPG